VTTFALKEVNPVITLKKQSSMALEFSCMRLTGRVSGVPGVVC
jgi:hypothetical protein